MGTLSLYEQDFYAWTQEQASLVKQKSFDKMDLVHIQQELELMGASEKRELSHRLEILLMHLLKWKYQPSRQCKSWVRTIKVRRNSLSEHLKNNPSLNARIDDYINPAYENAVLMAADETNLDEAIFPSVCEWKPAKILDAEFFTN